MVLCPASWIPDRGGVSVRSSDLSRRHESVGNPVAGFFVVACDSQVPLRISTMRSHPHCSSPETLGVAFAFSSTTMFFLGTFGE
jgi:hypothetical protein